MTDAVVEAAAVEGATGVPEAAGGPAPTPAPNAAGAQPGAEAKPSEAPLAGGGGKDGAPAPQDWPDDWRQKIAGEDQKVLDKLSRYGSPNDVVKALDEAQRKIRDGVKPIPRPGDKASDEEWAAYRKETGLPDTVEAFVESIKLPDGRKIGDNDKPIIEAFAERAHKMGMQPADMAGLLDEYYAIEEEKAALQSEKDAEYKATAQNQLRQEWGGEYKANINAMRPYFEGVDAEMFDNLMGGRLADGTKIGDSPNVIRFFVAKALQENPAATVVPAGANQIQAIGDEINALEKRMREDRDGWYKDQRAQERYQQLVLARDKLEAK